MNKSYYGTYPSTHPNKAWIALNSNESYSNNGVPPWMQLQKVEISQEEEILFFHIIWYDFLPSSIFINNDGVCNNFIKTNSSNEYLSQGYFSRGLLFSFQIKEEGQTERIQIIQTNNEEFDEPKWSFTHYSFLESPWTLVYKNESANEGWFGFGRLGWIFKDFQLNLTFCHQNMHVEINTYLVSDFIQDFSSLLRIPVIDESLFVDGNFSDWSELGLNKESQAVMSVNNTSPVGFTFNSISLARSKRNESTISYYEINPSLKCALKMFPNNTFLHISTALEVYLRNETHVSYSLNLYFSPYLGDSSSKEIILYVGKGKKGDFSPTLYDYLMPNDFGAFSEGVEIAFPNNLAPLLYYPSINEIELFLVDFSVVLYSNYNFK